MIISEWFSNYGSFQLREGATQERFCFIELLIKLACMLLDV